MSRRVYIGLGANLGRPGSTLAWAWGRLREWGPARVSSLYRSAPVDAQGPDFLNAVVELHSALPALLLLRQLLALELEQGRERPFRNAPRTLDLDLLACGDELAQGPELCLPHPRLQQRAFVLLPLLELAPALQLPGLGRLDAHLPALSGQTIECLGEFAAATAAR